MNHLTYKKILYACFSCRREFRKDIFKIPSFQISSESEQEFKCPQCNGELYKMDANFKAPSSVDEAKWKGIEVLHRNGFKFFGTSFS